MPVIGFEGLDGSGKTTYAKALARRLDGLCVTSLVYDAVWKSNRRLVNAGDDVEARFQYFLDMNRMQMSSLRVAAADKLVATLDTTIYRTVATHRVLGSVAAREYVIAEDEAPDRTFYIRLPEAERQRRLCQRDGGLVHPSKWDEILFEQRDSLREEYQRLGLTEIDGTADFMAAIREISETISV